MCNHIINAGYGKALTVQLEGKKCVVMHDVKKTSWFVESDTELNIHQQNFHVSSKMHENCKTFLLLNFCCLRYTQIFMHTVASS